MGSGGEEFERTSVYRIQSSSPLFITHFPSRAWLQLWRRAAGLTALEKGKQTELFSSVKISQIKKLSIWVASLSFLFFLPSFPSRSFSLSFLPSLPPSLFPSFPSFLFSAVASVRTIKNNRVI